MRAAPLEHSDEREHRRQIAQRANSGLPFDGTGQMIAPLVLKSYAVADVPDASLYTAGLIYVSDESGGAVVAFSDGTDWRRSSDRAVIS